MSNGQPCIDTDVFLNRHKATKKGLFPCIPPAWEFYWHAHYSHLLLLRQKQNQFVTLDCSSPRLNCAPPWATSMFLISILSNCWLEPQWVRLESDDPRTMCKGILGQRKKPTCSHPRLMTQTSCQHACWRDRSMTRFLRNLERIDLHKSPARRERTPCRCNRDPASEEVQISSTVRSCAKKKKLIFRGTWGDAPLFGSAGAGCRAPSVWCERLKFVNVLQSRTHLRKRSCQVSPKEFKVYL